MTAPLSPLSSSCVSLSQIAAQAERRIKFKVEDETIECKLSFLLTLPYFVNLFQAGMQEAQSGVIEVKDFSKSAFKHFIDFLNVKTVSRDLPFNEMVELLFIAHKYEFQGLEELCKGLVFKDQNYAGHLEELFNCAWLLNDSFLKGCCLRCFERNPGQHEDFLYKLAKDGGCANGVLEEVLKWRPDLVLSLLRYQDKVSNENVFDVLLKSGQYSLCKLIAIKFQKHSGVSTKTIKDPRYVIDYLLSDEVTKGNHPSIEVTTLVILIAQENPSVLTQGEKKSPLYKALVMGWDELFEQMVSLINISNEMSSPKWDPSHLDVFLSEAIARGRLAPINSLGKIAQNFSTRFEKFVLEGIATGQPQVVESLLNFSNLTSAPFVSKASVDASIRMGNTQIFTLIWKRYCSTLHAKFESFQHLAYSSNNFEISSIIFSDCDSSSQCAAPNVSWLMHAANGNCIERLKFMLKRAKDLSVQNSNSQTFYHVMLANKALKFDENDLREILTLDSASAVKVVDKDNNTPLHIAIKLGRHDEAFCIASKEPNILFATNKERTNPFLQLTGPSLHRAISHITDRAISSDDKNLMRHLLLWCATHNYFPYCVTLIKAGADFTIYLANGKNLLHLACEAGLVTAAGQLITLGLSVNSIEEQKKTPLHLAIAKKNLPLAKLLVERKADVNAADMNLSTPLHLAVQMENVELVAFLLESGANPHSIDDLGKSPLTYAIESNKGGVNKNMQAIVVKIESMQPREPDSICPIQ